MKNSLYRSFKFTFSITPFAHIMYIAEEIWQALFHAIATIIISRFIDSVITFTQVKTNANTVILYGCVLASLYFFNELWALVYNYSINIGIYEKPNNYANLLLAKKTAKLKLIDFEDAKILNMHKYAKENIQEEYLSSATTKIIYLVCRIIEIASLIFVLSSFDSRLFFVAIVSVVPYFITRIIRGKEMYLYKTIQIPEERRLDYLWNLFTDKSSGKELRITGGDKYIKNIWLQKNKKNITGAIKLRKKDSLSVLLCDLLSSVGYAFAIFICLYLVMNKKITIGNFSASIGAFTTLQFAMKVFLESLGSLPTTQAYTKHFFDFMDLPEEVIQNQNTNNKFKLTESIELTDVSFAYPNAEHNAVEQINLKINTGERIAVIGENGSGKTTLSKLILGLYAPKHGTVLWDRQNILQLNKEQLYTDVSIVSQQPVRYNFSLRENIAISNLKELNNDKKIISALKENATDYILQKTNGLDGMLGRTFDGAELSGGEWQRISLSRCIFKDANILVLDEPTSALDPIEETNVLKQFLNMTQGKTAIIISHRVGLCKLVDKIIVMKNGSIVGIGSHNELFKTCTEYQNLYNGQADLYK